MEQPEIEILEPVTNWEKELPALAKLVETEVVVQQMIVNNEVQEIKGKAFVLTCPDCGKILQQFPAGVPEGEIASSLCTDDENKLNGYMYCLGCGKKIQIFRSLPLDDLCEVTDVEDVE